MSSVCLDHCIMSPGALWKVELGSRKISFSYQTDRKDYSYFSACRRLFLDGQIMPVISNGSPLDVHLNPVQGLKTVCSRSSRGKWARHCTVFIPHPSSGALWKGACRTTKHSRTGLWFYISMNFIWFEDTGKCLLLQNKFMFHDLCFLMWRLTKDSSQGLGAVVIWAWLVARESSTTMFLVLGLT